MTLLRILPCASPSFSTARDGQYVHRHGAHLARARSSWTFALRDRHLHTFHSVGMFAFTITLGKLADRVGRSRIMFPGVFVSLIGAALVAFTPNLVTVTLGTFLVGVGWAAANVAATAFTRPVTTTERGRAIGLNDTFAGVSTVFAAFVHRPV